MVGTGRGAQAGILFKNAEALETMHGINTVVLDKTGTLTEGKPQVTDVLPFGTDEAELLRAAAALEKPSGHPLAEPIVNEAQKRQIEFSAVQSYKLVPGRGVVGELEGERYLAGNRNLMDDEGIDISVAGDAEPRLAAQGKTPLYFAKGGSLIGIIAVADVLKPTSREAVETLGRMGIDVVMLTGDNEATANAIGKMAGVTQVIAGVLPADTEREVRRLQGEGKKVAMVGDGINDAPALARADVGVAIGAGTDVAIESANVVLMKSDLLDVPSAIALSRSVMRNIKQNLFWAFIYNAIGIPLAAGVLYPVWGFLLNPMIAAAAMGFSSVSVVTNALRLRFFTPKWRVSTNTNTTNINNQNLKEAVL
jgi:heavy metal translocating P-type ATPase